MSLMNEYITKKYSTVDMIKELRKLIKLYNDKQGTYLLVYAGAISKPIPDISLNMDAAIPGLSGTCRNVILASSLE